MREGEWYDDELEDDPPFEVVKSTNEEDSDLAKYVRSIEDAYAGYDEAHDIDEPSPDTVEDDDLPEEIVVECAFWDIFRVVVMSKGYSETRQAQLLRQLDIIGTKLGIDVTEDTD